MPAAEVFLLRNACADACLLLLVCRWQGVRARPGRVALGAALGAGGALAAAALGGWLTAFPFKALLCAAMGLTGLGRRNALRAQAALWAGALVTGGAFRLGLPALAAGCLTGFAVCAIPRGRAAPHSLGATVAIDCGARKIRVRAIFDSGCLALDPQTMRPVIVVPGEWLPLPSDTRPLAIRTAAGCASLPCFTPQRVLVDGTPVRASVAAAPAGMLETALVPWALRAQRRNG